MSSPKRQPPTVHTYSAGEDKGRLASQAASLGLDSHRRPRRQVRGVDAIAEEGGDAIGDDNAGIDGGEDAVKEQEGPSLGSRLLYNVGLLFFDTTLEAARMHAVGVLGEDEVEEEIITADGRILITGDYGAAAVEDKDESKKKKKKAGAGAAGLQDLFKRKSEDDLSKLTPSLEATPPTPRPSLDAPTASSHGHGHGHGGSLTASAFGIIKAMVGPAILYLPRGFSESGYAFALSVMAYSLSMYLYSAMKLLECWKVESIRPPSFRFSISGTEGQPLFAHEEQGDVETVGLLQNAASNTSIGRNSKLPASLQKHKHHQNNTSSTHSHSHESHFKMLSYPELARRAFGNTGETIVRLGIALMQFGVCLTYCIFVPQNLHEFASSVFGWEVDMGRLLMVLVLVEVPLSWIRDIRKLTYTNILADFLIIYGLASCLGFAFFPEEDATTGSSHESIFYKMTQLRALNDHWYLFIGTSVLVFEGSITLLVPLQEAVTGQENRAKFPSMYWKVIMGIVVFYCIFATICWASFGDGVNTVLTTSLPQGGVSSSVQFAYSIAVIFTFPLQNFPALEIVCRSAFQCLPGNTNSKRNLHLSNTFMREVITTATVILLAIVAYLAIDDLGNVVSLTGSLLGVPIAFVFPPLIHNRLVKENSRSTVLLNNFVAGLGVVTMVAASISTCLSWQAGTGG